MTDGEKGKTVVVRDAISAESLSEMAAERFGDMVKAVVDIKLRLLCLGGGLHSDEEGLLIEMGSDQQDLWGINIYPALPRSEWIEFDSMINVRPRQSNRSRGVDNPDTRRLIAEIVDSLIK